MEEPKQEISTNGLKKLNENLKKYYYVWLVILMLTAAALTGYAIYDRENFKKNACQICESYGVHCYTQNESLFDVRLPNMVRIDQLG
jgi:hypothetical protein